MPRSTSATLYIVASGVLEITRQGKQGSTDNIGRVGAGECVGEMGLLTGAPHVATATALTHCQIYQLSGDAVAPLLRGNDELTSHFGRSVRRGLEILRRDSAARAEDVGSRGQLLQRIRRFFHADPT